MTIQAKKYDPDILQSSVIAIPLLMNFLSIRVKRRPYMEGLDKIIMMGAGEGIRTLDVLLGKQALYR